MKENPATHEGVLTPLMRAVRVHQFGGSEAIVYEEAPRPAPAEGQVLVRVEAAGVGPRDAWVKAGKSVLHQPLPLILGSDLAGVILEVGPGVAGFSGQLTTKLGEELPLVEARLAHEMLAGKPHKPGKIVLVVGA